MDDARRAGRPLLPWALLTVAVVMVVAGAWLHIADWNVCAADNARCAMLRAAQQLPPRGSMLALGVIGLVFAAVGAVVLHHHHAHRVGWLLLAVGVAAAGHSFGVGYVLHGVEPTAALPGAAVAGSLADVTFNSPAMFGLFALALLLFPDGALPSRRWRPVAVGLVASTVALFAIAAFKPRPLVSAPWLSNPFGVAWMEGPSDVAELPLLAVLLLGVVLSAVALGLRFRRSRGVLRQQMIFVVAAGIVVLILAASAPLFWSAGGAASTALWLGLFAPAITAIPVAAGVGILRYRLFDIDVVVNRTLLYTALAAFVVAVYVAAVAGVGRLVDSAAPTTTALPLVATAVAAVAFESMRRRVQQWVNRFMYGQRDDPLAVLAHLRHDGDGVMTPAGSLVRMAETMAHTLRLPFVAIDYATAGTYEQAAQFGTPNGKTLTLPLTADARPVGQLRIGLFPGDELTRAHRARIERFSGHVAVAVHAARLADDLQESRRRLVVAQEEERRRLRRDLHDGLGPTLAGVTMGLEAVRTMAEADPVAVRQRLGRLVDQLESAMGDLHRVADGLRPPELDRVGLVSAIRQRAIFLLDAADPPVKLRFTTATLPALPAAVEVAAYRIAVEAVTNVARHARATSCSIDLAVNGSLEIDVADDGVGTNADVAAGIGTLAMHERAAELGGRCAIGLSSDGGTRVWAQLPLLGAP